MERTCPKACVHQILCNIAVQQQQHCIQRSCSPVQMQLFPRPEQTMPGWSSGKVQLSNAAGRGFECEKKGESQREKVIKIASVAQPRVILVVLWDCTDIDFLSATESRLVAILNCREIVVCVTFVVLSKLIPKQCRKKQVTLNWVKRNRKIWHVPQTAQQKRNKMYICCTFACAAKLHAIRYQKTGCTTKSFWKKIGALFVVPQVAQQMAILKNCIKKNQFIAQHNFSATKVQHNCNNSNNIAVVAFQFSSTTIR